MKNFKKFKDPTTINPDILKSIENFTRDSISLI